MILRAKLVLIIFVVIRIMGFQPMRWTCPRVIHCYNGLQLVGLQSDSCHGLQLRPVPVTNCPVTKYLVTSGFVAR